jgi:hypothetical protein
MLTLMISNECAPHRAGLKLAPTCYARKKPPFLNEAGALPLEISPYQAALPEQSGYFKHKM